MTDAQPAPHTPDWTNVAAGVVGTIVTLAGLAAVSLAKTPIADALALCGPIVTACATVIKTR